MKIPELIPDLENIVDILSHAQNINWMLSDLKNGLDIFKKEYSASSKWCKAVLLKYNMRHLSDIYTGLLVRYTDNHLPQETSEEILQLMDQLNSFKQYLKQDALRWYHKFVAKFR